ncbi:Gfo/Idh/MocA family protein [Phyllobacterium chamaecytisi]|uniref:Gfo/Idh/MocA family protein n=1 Tax=Phyllobacterium chamaecytisi TaxID=2876082 RepID=UPI001CCF0EB5|nr:Gfo/Idh/MocA family oxidoreductase [Phyllobacterium sp. KW56]MBZ9603144.1 Gfo/Idh/MocA family oxidoreductase [Phyllobacterium sp. KW56]
MRVRLGIIGAGLISQVEHVPNVLALPDRFELVAIADPSFQHRDFIEQRYGLATYTSYRDMLDGVALDAVIIASPEHTHYEIACAALKRGHHVLCEKPLCYLESEIEDLIACRDATGLIFQVAHMKRWDPTVEMFFELISGKASQLRFIGVEVNDPNYWPFIEQHATRLETSTGVASGASAEDHKGAMVDRALGSHLDSFERRSVTGPFFASMVHDINLIHGICDAMGVMSCEAMAGAFFAEGWGGSCLLSLNGEQALGQVAHVTVPHLADYLERISVFLDDCRYELRFPSPYLNSQPTELIRISSSGNRQEVTSFRSGFREAFVRELEGFHEAIMSGRIDRNSLEDAKRDVRLLLAASRLAIASRSNADVKSGAQG